jgi:hypothetical protein
MKTLILNLVTTNRGWLVRQALKSVTYVSGSLTAFLAAKGADAELTNAIGLGLLSATSWAIETALSFVARKYAV